MIAKGGLVNFEISADVSTREVFDANAYVYRKGGKFRIHSSVYSDPKVFAVEMQRIFNRTWIYVGHESEVPKPGNYKTAHLGLQPVIVSRGDDGAINVLYNRCRHRGAVVCREPKGFAHHFRCPYHGWIYGKDGHLIGVGMRDGYPKDFAQPEGLLRVPRVHVYKGFIFASGAEDGVGLEAHLGLAKTWIDRRVAMSPTNEIEIVSEPFVSVYEGNWKFQVENIVDEYHFAFVHEPFNKLMQKYGQETGDYGAHVAGDAKDMNRRRQAGRRGLAQNGIGLSEQRASDDDIDALLEGEHSEYYRELLAVHGRKELGYMIGNGAFMLLPNIGMIHRQIRVVRPISVNKTEVTIYPYEVKGAPREHNEGHIRSQERFYGPAGYGAPDDVEMFALNQEGLRATSVEHLILERGLDTEQQGEDGTVHAPVGSEAPLRGLWRGWLDLMNRPLED